MVSREYGRAKPSLLGSQEEGEEGSEVPMSCSKHTLTTQLPLGRLHLLEVLTPLSGMQASSEHGS